MMLMKKQIIFLLFLISGKATTGDEGMIAIFKNQNTLLEKIIIKSEERQKELLEQVRLQNVEIIQLKKDLKKLESETAMLSEGMTTNIQQCTSTTYTSAAKGVLFTCSGFIKKKSSTALRISWNGNVRNVQDPSGGCRRWYIAINNKECSNPGKIAFVDSSHQRPKENHHRPAFVEGLCLDIPRGPVTLSLNTSPCTWWNAGRAGTPSTGGNEYYPSRFLIEEIGGGKCAGIR